MRVLKVVSVLHCSGYVLSYHSTESLLPAKWPCYNVFMWLVLTTVKTCAAVSRNSLAMKSPNKVVIRSKALSWSVCIMCLAAPGLSSILAITSTPSPTPHSLLLCSPCPLGGKLVVAILLHSVYLRVWLIRALHSCLSITASDHLVLPLRSRMIRSPQRRGAPPPHPPTPHTHCIYARRIGYHLGFSLQFSL